MRLVFFILIAVLIASGGHPAVASVEVVEGARFPYRLSDADQQFHLYSATLLKALRLFRIYSIALYLEDVEHASRVLDDVPKRLEVEYLRAVPADRLAELSYAHLETIYPEAFLERFEKDLDTFTRGYVDFAPGDRCAITYIPGRGTELSINGVPRCLVPGKEFAQLYFSLWLGEEPLDRNLRARLLNDRITL